MALIYGNNATRLTNFQTQQYSQNVEKLQAARILLSQPDKGQKQLNDSIVALRILESEQGNILHTLLTDSTNTTLQRKHIELSGKIKQLEQKIQQFSNQYIDILAQAHIAQSSLQKNDAPLIQQLNNAQHEIERLVPTQFVSSVNADITKMFQNRVIVLDILREKVEKYDQLTNISPFENVELQHFVNSCKTQFDIIHRQMSELQNDTPNTEWEKFRTDTLPNSQDIASQDISRREAEIIVQKLKTAIAHIQSLSSTLIIIPSEPNPTNWSGQLKWFFWETLMQQQIALSLEKQQVYGMYISATLAQRALGLPVDSILLADVRKHLQALSQVQFKSQHARPDFTTMWNLLIGETINAVSDNDSHALRRTMRAVHVVVSSILPRELCIDEAQQLIEIFLACTTCVSFNSSLTQTCMVVATDLTNELQTLNDQIENAITNLTCDAKVDVCNSLKAELMQNHAQQIAFLKYSLKLLNTNILKKTKKQHLTLRLPIPEHFIPSSGGGGSGGGGHISPVGGGGKSPVGGGGGKSPIGSDPLLAAKKALQTPIDVTMLNLSKIFAWYHLAKTFPLFPEDNFPHDANEHLMNFIASQDLQGKIGAEMESILNSYVPEKKNEPFVKTFVTTKNPALRSLLDKYLPATISPIADTAKTEILRVMDLCTNLKTNIMNANEIVTLNAIGTSAELIEAGRLDHVITNDYTTLKVDHEDAVKQLQIEVIENIINAAPTLVNQVPLRPKKPSHCKVNIEQDIELHTTLERKNFEMVCQTLITAECLDDIKRATQCPAFATLVTDYKNNEHTGAGITSNPLFPPLKIKAVALEQELTILENEVQTKDAALRKMFPVPTTYDLYDDALQFAKKAVTDQQKAKDKILELQTVIASIDTKQSELDATLTAVDALFPAGANPMTAIHDTANQLKTKTAPYVWVIANILKTSIFYPMDVFPLLYYQQLTQLLSACVLGPTRDELKVCVDKFESLRDKSAIELGTFIGEAGLKLPPLQHPDMAAKMSNLVDVHFAALDRILLMPLTTTDPVEIQKAKNELASMQIVFDSLTKTFNDDVKADALKQNTEVLKQIISHEEKLTKNTSGYFTTNEACELKPLETWLPTTRRDHRQKFTDYCIGYIQPDDDSHCVNEKKNNTDLKDCQDIKDLLRELDLKKKDDILTREPKYAGYLAKVLQTHTDFEAKKEKFLEADAKLSALWKSEIASATAPTIDVNETDIPTAMTNSKALLDLHKVRVAHAQTLQQERDKLLHELVDAQKLFDEAQDKIDMLRIKQYKLDDPPYESQVSECERRLPITRNRLDMIIECEDECKHKLPLADLQNCIDTKILPLAESMEPYIANDIRIKNILTSLQDALRNEIKHDDTLKLLGDQSLAQWTKIKAKLNDPFNIPPADLLNAESLKQKTIEEEKKVTAAYEEQKTLRSDLQKTFDRIVAEYNVKFGKKQFSLTPNPNLHFTSHPSVECSAKFGNDLLKYTKAQQLQWLALCASASQDCKADPQKEICLHNKLTHAAPEIIDPIFATINHDPANISFAVSLAATIHSDQLKLLESQIEAAYANWDAQLQKPYDIVELTRLGEAFELAQKEYLTYRTTVLVTQTTVDLMLMDPDDKLIAMLTCYVKFDGAATQKLELSMKSRYTLLPLCQSFGDSYLYYNPYQSLLTLAHQKDTWNNTPEALQELEDARILLGKSYAKWQKKYNGITVMRNNIKDYYDLLRTNPPQTLVDLKSIEDQLRQKLFQLLLETQAMVNEIHDLETKFDQKLVALNTDSPTHLQEIYTNFKNTILTHPVASQFKTQYNNIKKVIQDIKNYPVTENKSADAVLAVLKNPSNAATIYRSVNGPFHASHVNKLNATITEITNVLAEIEQDAIRIEPLIFALESFASTSTTNVDLITNLSILQNPKMISFFDDMVEKIITFNEKVGMLEEQNKFVRIPTECTSIVNVDDVDFKSMCLSQGCKNDVNACTDLEKFGESLVLSYKAISASLSSIETKEWLKESQRKRIPLELELFALLPFNADSGKVIMELKTFLEKHQESDFIIDPVLLNDLNHVPIEVDNWHALTKRVDCIRQFVDIVNKFDGVRKQQQDMENYIATKPAAETFLRSIIEDHKKCEDNTKAKIAPLNIFNKLTLIIKNDLGIMANLPNFKSEMPGCLDYDKSALRDDLLDIADQYKSELEIIKKDFLQVFETEFQKFKSLFTNQDPLASLLDFLFEVTKTTSTTSLPLLINALDKLQADIVDYGQQLQDPDLEEDDANNQDLFEALGETGYIKGADFLPHIENLNISIDYVKTVIATFKNRSIATSLIPDSLHKKSCAAFFTQLLSDATIRAKIQDCLYVFMKLLQNSEPGDVEFKYKQADNIPLTLTCPAELKDWKVEETNATFKLGFDINTIPELQTWVTTNNKNMGNTFAGILVIDPAGSMFTNQKFEGGGFSGGLYKMLNIETKTHTLSALAKQVVFNVDLATPPKLTNFNIDATQKPVYVLHAHSPAGPADAASMITFLQGLTDTLTNIFAGILLHNADIDNFVILLPLLSSGIFATPVQKEVANQDLYAQTFMQTVVKKIATLPGKNTVLIPHPPPNPDPTAYVPDYAKALNDAQTVAP